MIGYNIHCTGLLKEVVKINNGYCNMKPIKNNTGQQKSTCENFFNKFV